MVIKNIHIAISRNKKPQLNKKVTYPAMHIKECYSLQKCYTFQIINTSRFISNFNYLIFGKQTPFKYTFLYEHRQNDSQKVSNMNKNL